MTRTPLIYLVDDQNIANFLNRRLIETAGITATVEDYTEAADALAFAKANKPDLILLDLNMPDMSGWDFIQDLERSDVAPAIFIVTSSTSNSDRERAAEFRIVKDYLVKPLRINAGQRIQSYLQNDWDSEGNN